MVKKRISKFKRIVLAGLMATGMIVPFTVQIPSASADSYRAETKTDADVLDYIENRRRAERENIRTDEQKKLLMDAHAMREALREPLDPTKNIPVAVEGDDLYYNQRNGDVRAAGNVVLTSIDGRRFITDKAIGNLKATEVKIDGKAHMLQLTPDQATVVMTGYKTQYNYKAKTGQMEDAFGKVGNQYVKAKRIEFYPEKVVLYKAYETKCSAKHPDYRLEADKIEYFPNKETIYHNLKLFAGDIPILSVTKKTISAKEAGMKIHLPKVGSNSDDGLWIQDKYDWDITERVNAYVAMKYKTRRNIRGNYGISWNTVGLGTFQVRSGYFEDGDNKWIRKSPAFDYRYANRIKGMPFEYVFTYERGSWHQDNISSMHTEYGLGITPDIIKLGAWDLKTYLHYGITKESYDDSIKHGWKYSATAIREFDKKWSYYVGYHYDYDNAADSPFDFDKPDYARRLSTGISYRFDDINRIVAGYAWDMERYTLKDIDYYWFRDIHCAQLIVRYRAKEGTMGFRLQFTPW